MEHKETHRRSQEMDANPTQQHDELQPGKDIRIEVQKTFLESKGVVFYEIHIHFEAGLTMPRDAGQPSHAIPSNSTFIIHRRYKHFKLFHKKLCLLLNKEEPGTQGPTWLKQLPKLPPLRPKLFVDHSSPYFISDRSRALEVYLERVLRYPLLQFVLKSAELTRWLTDLPEPFYLSSQGNCPYLYRCWKIFSPCSIQAWGESGAKENVAGENNIAIGAQDVWAGGEAAHKSGLKFPAENMQLLQSKKDALSIQAFFR
jgi:hypothetical protein